MHKSNQRLRTRAASRYLTLTFESSAVVARCTNIRALSTIPEHNITFAHTKNTNKNASQNNITFAFKPLSCRQH